MHGHENSKIWIMINLARKSEIFIKNYAEILSAVGGFDRAVVKFG